MKKIKTLTLVILLFIIILFLILYIIYPSREKKLIKYGNHLINEIENYKDSCGMLPNSLYDICIKERIEGPIYYQRVDSSKYMLWFGMTLGESYTYESSNGKWQEK
jgi:predicted PurR-regulated permease PerM